MVSEKTIPFGVDLTRSLVIYQAAQMQGGRIGRTFVVSLVTHSLLVVSCVHGGGGIICSW